MLLKTRVKTKVRLEHTPTPMPTEGTNDPPISSGIINQSIIGQLTETIMRQVTDMMGNRIAAIEDQTVAKAKYKTPTEYGQHCQQTTSVTRAETAAGTKTKDICCCCKGSSKSTTAAETTTTQR